MRDTRASIFIAGCSRSARIAVRAALISWMASFIHSSDVWCWMMNSISSWAVDKGACAESTRSSRRYSP
jgi:hypothetical protein